MKFLGVTEKIFAVLLTIFGIYNFFIKDDYKPSTKIIIFLLVICLYLVIKVIDLYIKLKKLADENITLSSKNENVTTTYKKNINETKLLKQQLSSLRMAFEFYKQQFTMFEHVAPTISSKKAILSHLSYMNHEGGIQIEKTMESHTDS